jgi:hypothetical protein
MLQLGVWDMDDLIHEWIGTQFSPRGVCPQVQGIVKSPLDAVARYLRQRRDAGDWVPPHH